MALLTEVNFIKPLFFRTVNFRIYFQSPILAATLRPEQVKPNFKKMGETARSMRKVFSTEDPSNKLFSAFLSLKITVK